jgi:hypothetical protein
MADLRSYIAQLKRMRAEDQRLLDKLNSSRPEGVDLEARAETLRELNFAAEIDNRVIQALEEISRSQPLTTSVERLGYVLGWTGNVLATLVLILTAHFGLTALSKTDRIFVAVIGFVVASALFGIGRALRYVFAGK